MKQNTVQNFRPTLCHQLIFNKDAQVIQHWKGFSRNDFRTIGYHLGKKQLSHHLIPYTKIKSKFITYLNVEANSKKKIPRRNPMRKALQLWGRQSP